MRTLTRSFAALTAALLVLAAPALAAEVSVRVSPQKASIGDELRLYVRFTAPESWQLGAVGEGLDLSPFEIKRAEMLPARASGPQLTRTVLLTLTVFELGELTVPAFDVPYTDAQGRPGRLRTQPVKVTVRPLVKAAPGGQAPKPKPIKGLASLDLSGYRDAALGALAAILALALALKVWLRRRARGPADPDASKPAHERARIELDRLRKGGHLAAKRTKEHYSGLTDILRRYLLRRFGIDAADRTTPEILEAVKAAGLEGPALDALKRVTSSADLVKFAKYDPPFSETEAVEGALLEFIEATRPREEAPRR